MINELKITFSSEGTTRLIIILESKTVKEIRKEKYGNFSNKVTKRNIVMKIPRIRLLFLYQELRRLCKDILKGEKRSTIISSLEIIWEWLTLGLMENYREAVCWHKTKHPLLTKLYFSLGFINFYRFEEGAGKIKFDYQRGNVKKRFTFGKLWEIVAKKEYREEIGAVGHTFSNPENFSYHKGKLTLLDYGAKGVLELLEKSGNQIIDDLMATIEEKPRR
ncbi:MAG: hypothetical protein WAV31_06470 [Candidatus Moraniibacteriota bacterium]